MGVTYEDQILAKERRVHDLLGASGETRWLPTVTSPESGYRNKAKMVVAGSADDPTLGILDENGLGVDLIDCGICAPSLRATFPAIIRAIRQSGLAPYSVPQRRGDIKYVIVTLSPSGEIMVRFIVRSAENIPALRGQTSALISLRPEIKVISVNIQPDHKAVLEGDEEVILTPQKHLTMSLAGLELRLRPQSFFQTNTAVAAELYEQVRSWVHQTQPAKIWDLYCGVGGFAFASAGPNRLITGVETSKEAVRSARATAQSTGATTVTFRAADSTAFALNAKTHPDLVIVNPPRRGIGSRLGEWLNTSGIAQIIYSSCNPQSLRNDLDQLPGYRIREGRVLDMFPNTEHLEVAVLLERSPLPADQ